MVSLFVLLEMSVQVKVACSRLLLEIFFMSHDNKLLNMVAKTAFKKKSIVYKKLKIFRKIWLMERKVWNQTLQSL